MRHPVETLWREVGLPEYFLGNDGSNTKLYALYEAIRKQTDYDHGYADGVEWATTRNQSFTGSEVAKLMDKHGISPARSQFWLDLEALTSSVTSQGGGPAA